ncbi:hypothetical protein MgSA37_00794 [Mucilaginibacter gotjawali]|uniref:Uncharacterized protein n=2 Tax=Mucilaginibacter gotjawali TaxID=1550579 RepID=A0A839SEE5_9SPHI|nr:hypothetical protein [Mucilaginibacter gotjawali]BAU52632.1 hypothetical protein MgSA37_00794 [Mucilaginibacter gotjawali]
MTLTYGTVLGVWCFFLPIFDPDGVGDLETVGINGNKCWQEGS